VQVFQDESDTWELLHFDTSMGVEPVTQAWRDGQASDEDLAQVNAGLRCQKQAWLCAVVGSWQPDAS